MILGPTRGGRRPLRELAIDRALAAGTVAVSVLLSAGCVSVQAPVSHPPSATMTTPAPDGWAAADSGSTVRDSTECDATASLRPGPLPPPNQMPPGSTMAHIHDRGTLVVGVDIGSNLFSFRDPSTGDLEGFDVDVAREMANAIFGDPNRIEFRVLAPTDRVSALQSGAVDLVVKTMAISCDSLNDVAFSTVYFEASQRILTLRRSSIESVDDLANKRVCAARGSTSVERIKALAPSSMIYTASTWADCLVALQQDQVDAVSTDDATLAGLAAQDPYVHVVGASLGIEPYGIGISKDQPDLVRFVNGVLEQMRTNGRWYEIYNRWLAILGPADYPPQPSYRD